MTIAPVDAEKAAHYRQRADAFYEAMELLGDDLDSYREAPALLAVHTVVSLTDSIREWYTGQRGKADDHRAAAEKLRSLCGKLNLDTGGVKHLVWLVGKKDAFAYAERRVDMDDIESACTHADRFQTWAFKTFPAVFEKGMLHE